MQNDEYTPEFELDENQINMEETVEETVDTEDQEADEVDWKAEALKYKAIAMRKAKQANVRPEPKQQTLETNYLTREEGILIAKGMDDEALNQLKVIAKGKGVSLLDAEKDPLFTTYFEKVQKEKRAEQAKLGASKGSAYKETKAEFKSGLSREEHMALWKEQQ